MSKEFFVSPFGEFINPWFTKADTKFNADGLFHSELKIPTAGTESFVSRVEAAAGEALAKHVEKMTPGEAKKWKLYSPIKPEEDTEGNPTGNLLVDFKQNAKINLKSGEVKDVKIELRDSKDNIFNGSIWSGSLGRIMFTMRPIVMTSTKQVGVRLDFFKVQVTKLVKGGSGAGFGAVDGGFVAAQDDAKFGEAAEDNGEEY